MIKGYFWHPSSLPREPRMAGPLMSCRMAGNSATPSCYAYATKWAPEDPQMEPHIWHSFPILCPHQNSMAPRSLEHW